MRASCPSNAGIPALVGGVETVSVGEALVVAGTTRVVPVLNAVKKNITILGENKRTIAPW